MEAVVFEDDLIISELISTILRDHGWKFRTFLEGADAVGSVKRLRPKIVLTDIMMPGMDGLSICKALKSDPATKDTKIVILSARAYPEDKEEATKCGADAFLPKPFSPPDLIELVRKLLTEAGGDGEEKPRVDKPVLSASIWGSRSGDGKTPGPATSCVSLTLGDKLFILDAGSGLERLAASPFPGNLAKEVHVLLTHFHPDHLSGLPKLKWAAEAGLSIKFLGPKDASDTLVRAVQTGLAGVGVKAAVQLFGLVESTFKLTPQITIKALLTKHPGNTLAYRIEYQGRSFVYCPDNEIESGNDVQSDHQDRLLRFFQDADVLLHDARFLDEDFGTRSGAGHSCPGAIVDLAAKAGVRSLVLFHLDASYPKEKLDAALERAKKAMQGLSADTTVELGLEGWTRQL
ncbi:MAG: response regulator [Elusimicrobia bacterium]|nr:response regulator [Elusimicrobiota bacterium]